ncbi:regulatory LuxR family protein [Microterricola gilva]|uniref:Regulatory LuxR family protein n=1 Tax=Microterricola gilva TaxID=393267 RepID=A0A4Q8AKR2_9MICO|nr:LuxR family transcriptional regulator [Microterricola gilva]RZU65120.1 regulatory LuxR family protein [Microterricola gilva]
MPTDRALVGRQSELVRFGALCAQTGAGGSVLLIEGDPGVGKTALVDEYELIARERGMRVLRTSGTPDESAAPFSGLHLLLHPLRAQIPGLPEPQRDALEVAFGARSGETPTTFLAGVATLTLLSDASREHPLLVIGEDLHWLDPASRQTLLMVARRVSSDPVIVVMTTRGGHESVGTETIERVRLAPLSFIDANALLDSRSDSPDGTERRMLLELADGNPLALVELSVAGLRGADLNVVPLTRRLELAFAGRYAELSLEARLGVLAGSLGCDSIDDTSAAIARALGGAPSREWLVTAAAAGLLEPVHGRISLRHPLVRSAVASAAQPQERATMLRALVATIADPARTVWWRADLATGTDPKLAAELVQIGEAALGAGDAVLALRALRRAAELTVPSPARIERLLLAADAAGRAGAHRTAVGLLDEADAETDDSRTRARTAWMRELLPVEESALTRGDLRPATSAVENMRRSGDADAALDALLHLASIAWDHSNHSDPGLVISEAARAFDLDPDEPRTLLLDAVTNPAGRGDDVIARIRDHAGIDHDDAQRAWYLGYALNLCGEIEPAAEYLQRAVDGFREHGSRALLPHALMGLSWICFLQGRFERGRACIDECVTIAIDAEDPGLATAARMALAWYDALDGAVPDRDAIAGSSPLAALALEAQSPRATLVFAEGCAALVSGRPRDAEHALRRLADPNDGVYNLMFRIVSLPDLVEAAVLLGHRPLAGAQLAAMTELQEGWHAPVLSAALGYSRIVLCDDARLDEESERLERHPLPIPFLQARAHLHLGTRLRRMRRTADSRSHLRMALALFESFPATMWAQRARDELRAGGVRLPDVAPSGRHVLTPQELRVAELAAVGLSNREIAERLFLSPRTIGAHLYTAFRKLGITAREQLGGALRSE